MNQMMQTEENNSGNYAGHDQLNKNKENEEIKKSLQQVSSLYDIITDQVYFQS